MASAWPTGAYAPSTSPSVFDLLPQLSAEEKARFPPTGIGCTSEATSMSTVHDALRHYNAGHPGAEFDAVKPLKEDSVYFKGRPWVHINFWARSCSSKNIKRFFAEVHYEPPTDGRPFSLLPVVEACIILDESSSQHRSSCAFC
ncbi:hypothetical protein GQ55_4G237600 [Panicum hallii var. hallii]|uniref:DUF3615 domain-containing protein n=1 Tax=Panicum hallii var. hallii TaxID=1504633 RepID=A0A2T7DZL8_9POAL|nr:hypothetical protein GQ55_4G237600 [Panicum hallii var. hallii]